MGFFRKKKGIVPQNGADFMSTVRKYMQEIKNGLKTLMNSIDKGPFRIFISW